MWRESHQLPESARLSAATFHCGELRLDAPCCVVCTSALSRVGLLVSKPLEEHNFATARRCAPLACIPLTIRHRAKHIHELSAVCTHLGLHRCLERLRAKLGLSLPRFPLFPGWQSSQWPGNPWSRSSRTCGPQQITASFVRMTAARDMRCSRRQYSLFRNSLHVSGD